MNSFTGAKHVLIGFALLTVLSTLTLAAEPKNFDWPQFRGPARDGVSHESDLLPTWPDAGPKQVWKRPSGVGFSCLTIVGDRIYTMFAEEKGDEKTEYAAMLDASTGEEIWRVAVGERFDDDFGNGPRSTPTVMDGQAFFLGSRGRLMALNASDGKLQWDLDLVATFECRVPGRGFSGSPLVEGDSVFLEVSGGEGKAYAALDRKTGKTRWTALDGAARYSSPIAVTLGGKRQWVIVTTAGSKATLMALEPSGQPLWSHLFSEESVPIATPLQVGENGFMVSSDEGGALLVRVVDGIAQEAWRNPKMRNHFTSSVSSGGLIFGFDNATFKCLDAQTGEQKWAHRGLGKGTVLVADNRLILLSDQGKLVLAEVSAEGFKPTGSFQALEGKCWTPPSISHGRLYLRNHTEMACLDLRN